MSVDISGVMDALRSQIYDPNSTLHTTLHASVAAVDSARASLAPFLDSALADVKEKYGDDGPIYIAISSLLIAVATVAACRRLLSAAQRQRPKTKKKSTGATEAAKPAAAKPPKKKKIPKVRMCKYCEVPIPSDLFMQAHLAGKKHRKLAGEYTPEECWVWVEKPSEEGKDAEAKEAAPQPPVATDMQDEGTWETVESAASKKAKARVMMKAAKAKQAAAAAAAAAAPPPVALRVHRRCNDCGIRARDGATIETDPDNESRAYCTECWAAFLNHPEAAAPADSQPAAKPWVTPFNRD